MSAQIILNNRTPRRRGFLILLLLIVCGVVALPQLFYPLGFDQAVYAACGYVIKNGGVPIQDCFETKQMGVMLMYAIPMLFTLSPLAIHAFTLVWVAITAWVIGWFVNAMVRTTEPRLARISADVWPGVIAGALYWLIYAGINYWSMDQAETFANLLIVLAFYWLWRGAQNDGDIGRMLLAGACIGVAMWFKYVFGLLGVALGLGMLVHTLANKPSYPVQAIIANAITYALGVFIVLGLGIGYYGLVPNGLDTLLQQLNFLRANFPLAEPLPPPGMLQMMLRVFDNGADRSADFKSTIEQLNILGGGFPLIFGLVIIGLLRNLRRGLDVLVYLLLWLAAAIAIVIWQGNYIQYHYFVLWPPVVMLAGLALKQGEDTRKAGDENNATQSNPFSPPPLHFLTHIVALAAIVLLTLRMWPWINDAYINVVMQRKPLAQLYEESDQAPVIPMARYLREHSQPGDSLGIFGDAPWVYTLADRPNATRFSFVNVWIKKRGTPNYDRMVQQYLTDLQRNRPLYFLLTTPNYPWPNNDYIEDYKQAKDIYNYVEANYQYEAEIGEFLVFRRR